MSAICKHETLWTGNTYPIRDAIRRLGGKWNAEKKAWIVPPLSMRERSDLYRMCDGLKGITIQEAK